MTNFKPSSLNLIKNLKLKPKNTNNQIYCKHFYIYLILLKNKNNFFTKSEIFVKKLKKKVFTILKSPYRYKIARHQIAIKRYNIYFTTKILIKKKLTVQNWSNIINLVNYLKSFQKIFESNIIYINSLKFDVPISYKNNFIIKNYFKNN